MAANSRNQVNAILKQARADRRAHRVRLKGGPSGSLRLCILSGELIPLGRS